MDRSQISRLYLKIVICVGIGIVLVPFLVNNPRAAMIDVPIGCVMVLMASVALFRRRSRGKRFNYTQLD